LSPIRAVLVFSDPQITGSATPANLPGVIDGPRAQASPAPGFVFSSERYPIDSTRFSCPRQSTESLDLANHRMDVSARLRRSDGTKDLFS
jgi:hypothetical protein